METLSQWFWSEWIWLPEGYSWEDVRPKPGNLVKYTNFNDLAYPIFIGLALVGVRKLTEKLLLEKLGIKLGLRPGRAHVPQPRASAELMQAYDDYMLTRSGKKLSHRDIEKLAKESHMEIRQVERWLRWKSVQNKPTRLNKFCESGWKFICYTTLWILGLAVLYDKPWFTNVRECYIGYPNHSLDNDIWWYYILSTSFYWSLLITQFSDVKRKDFWEMFAHHLTTIGLLCFSWVGNLTRIGSLVILLHDTADVFLEIGKMAKYAYWERLCDCIFGVFTVVWIITRLGIYPWYILSSTLFEATTIVKIFPAYYIFNSLLTVLFCLHIFWTYYIFKVAASAVTKGQYEDARSSTEDEYEDEKKRG